MLKHGDPIEAAAIWKAINPGIRYSQAFEEFEACIGAGLDVWAWEQGHYPTAFKAQVIAWWRLHSLIQTHLESERARAAERAAKKG